MNKRTREALEKSIKHWEDMLKKQNPHQIFLGTDACALCRIYIDAKGCGECPVALKTGEARCGGTPYYIAWKAWNVWWPEYLLDGDTEHKYKFRAACRKEIEFLKSLREDETK